MRKILTAAGSVLFFCVAPGTVAGLIPWAIAGWPVSPGSLWLAAAGGGLIVLGLVPLVESFWRFAAKGLGTPAPVAPTRRLVVSGFYRHVRNPMYVGVVAIILGEALLCADPRLAVYAAGVAVLMHLFVMLYEEPTLRRSYGADYERYCAQVPRWLPRLQAWNG